MVPTIGTTTTLGHSHVIWKPLLPEQSGHLGPVMGLIYLLPYEIYRTQNSTPPMCLQGGYKYFANLLLSSEYPTQCGLVENCRRFVGTCLNFYQIRLYNINHFKTKHRLSKYLKTQFVPRSKNFSSRL